MNQFHDKTSLSEKSVQKVARDNLKKPRRKPTSRRVLGTRVKVSIWSDGLDDRIVAYIKSRNIAPSRLEIKSPTEVIIHNPKPLK